MNIKNLINKFKDKNMIQANKTEQIIFSELFLFLKKKEEKFEFFSAKNTIKNMVLELNPFYKHEDGLNYSFIEDDLVPYILVYVISNDKSFSLLIGRVFANKEARKNYYKVGKK